MAGLATDVTFRIESREFAMVELVHDPQNGHYRYSAQVRHDESHGPGSAVGLYFAYRSLESEPGFCVVQFNGLMDKPKFVRNFPGNEVESYVYRQTLSRPNARVGQPRPRRRRGEGRRQPHPRGAGDP